jgi:hypothetical protein
MPTAQFALPASCLMPHLGMNRCLIFFAALFVSTTLFAAERGYVTISSESD